MPTQDLVPALDGLLGVLGGRGLPDVNAFEAAVGALSDARVAACPWQAAPHLAPDVRAQLCRQGSTIGRRRKTRSGWGGLGWHLRFQKLLLAARLLAHPSHSVRILCLPADTPACLPACMHAASPVCSKLAQVGSRLAALDARTQWVLHVDVAVAVMPAAMFAVELTTRMALEVGCDGQQREQVLSAGTLLLGSTSTAAHAAMDASPVPNPRLAHLVAFSHLRAARQLVLLAHRSRSVGPFTRRATMVWLHLMVRLLRIAGAASTSAVLGGCWQCTAAPWRLSGTACA